MIPQAEFGRTGHSSSRLLFGAAALWNASAAEADRALGLLLDAGVNHIDTAASYGRSEEALGPALRGRRESFFLATKTDKRTKAEALAQLEASLRLLGVDHVDLWQLHNLTDEEDWSQATGPGGVFEALDEAKSRGLVRFVGVTGHGRQAPELHLRSLALFPFDSVLLPWNWSLSRVPEYAEGLRSIQTLRKERLFALQLIKTLCRRPWGDRPHTRITWYEPIEGAGDISRALGWAFGIEGAFVNSAGDLGLLPGILAAAAAGLRVPSDAEMTLMAERLGMEDLFV
ncbi:MAG: aldo/keto reductase [Spirochaetaceae bacterium]|nr:aldo/keto reductase [Spirochaetaceae bacterium]